MPFSSKTMFTRKPMQGRSIWVHQQRFLRWQWNTLSRAARLASKQQERLCARYGEDILFCCRKHRWCNLHEYLPPLPTLKATIDERWILYVLAKWAPSIRACENATIKSDGVRCAAASLLKRYKLLLDSSPIKPDQMIYLSKAIKRSTAILRRKARLTEIPQSVLSYARAAEEENVVYFADVCMLHIMDNIMSGNFLAGRSPATYVCYVTVDATMVNQKRIGPPLLNIVRYAPAGKTLAIKRPWWPSFLSIFKGTSSSCYRPLIRSLVTTASIPDSTQLNYTGTWKRFLMKFMFASRINAKTISDHCALSWDLNLAYPN